MYDKKLVQLAPSMPNYQTIGYYLFNLCKVNVKRGHCVSQYDFWPYFVIIYFEENHCYQLGQTKICISIHLRLHFEMSSKETFKNYVTQGVVIIFFHAI